MPNPSEHKLEALLRAWAKQRRKDFGRDFEVHPATRRLLLGEVARNYPKRPRRQIRWGVYFSALRSRLTGLMTLFAVLLITAWGAETFWSSWTHSNDPKSLEDSPPRQMWSLRKHPAEEAERLFAALNKPSNPPPALVVTTAPPAAPKPAERVPLFGSDEEKVPASKLGAGDPELAGARMLDPFSPAQRAFVAPKSGVFNPAVPPLLVTGGVAALTESLGKKPSAASPARMTGSPPLVPTNQAPPVRPGTLLADRTAASSLPSAPVAPTMLAAKATSPAKLNEIATPSEPPARATGYSFARIGDDARSMVGKQTDAEARRSLQGATAETRSDSVLARFEIKRDGPKITLLDADGSVYEGQLLADDRLASPTRLGVASGTAAKSARSLEPRADAAPRRAAASHDSTQPTSAPTTFSRAAHFVFRYSFFATSSPSVASSKSASIFGFSLSFNASFASRPS